MPISRGSSATASAGAGAATQTISFNNVAGTFMVVVFRQNVLGTDTVTSVKYNGVTMTQGQKVTTNGNARYAYYLFSPALGTNNLVIANSSNNSAFVVIATYVGTVSTGLDNSQALTGTGTSFTDSLTTVANNCWVIEGLDSIDDGWTQGTGSNLFVTGGSPANGTEVVDSNGVKSPAGSYSMTNTRTAGTRNSLRFQLSVAPKQPPATIGFFGLFDSYFKHR